jgi:hypothetical protein
MINEQDELDQYWGLFVFGFGLFVMGMHKFLKKLFG